MSHVVFSPQAIAFPNILQPTVFQVSDDLAVELLLTDIPFFSAGLLAFGVFTFLFFVKRVTVPSVYLFASALLAFVGSVADLVPILALARSSRDNKLSLANPYIVVHGTAFAISIGFRFLFFWTFVAQPIEGEQLSAPENGSRKGDLFDLFNLRERGHSASWGRWGIPGLFLKWSLLGLTFVIPILQILWRDVGQLQKSLYFAGSAIEAVVSALFIAKLGLNVLVSSSPWRRTLLFYLASALALAISLGLAVTNVVVFFFSETTPGRFLQAIELYILIVYNLICTFYQPNNTPATPQLKRNSSFQPPENQPLSSNFNAFPQDIPDAVLLIGRHPYSHSRSSDGHLSYLSMASHRFSSLFRPSTKSSRRQSGAERLWDHNGAEKGRLPALNGQTIGLGPKPTPGFANGFQSDRMVNRPISETGTAISTLSYYNTVRNSGRPLANFNTVQTLTTGSPVYGLNSIMSNDHSRRTSPVSTPYRNSVSSIDDILRKQKELDKSIEALRLSSPGMKTFPTQNVASVLPRSTSLPKITRGDSTSVRSEISLSSFPEPPSTSKLSSMTARHVLRHLQRRKGEREDKPGDAAVPPPIVIPPVDEDISGRLPQTVTGTGDTRRFQQFDSAGTQYDVTSFIGDLTGPVLTGLTSAPKTSRLSDVQSNDEISPVSVTKAERLPRAVVASPNNPPYSDPATASSGLLNSQLFTGKFGAPGGLSPKSVSSVTTEREPSPVKSNVFRDVGMPKFRGLPIGPRATVVGPRSVAGR